MTTPTGSTRWSSSRRGDYIPVAQAQGTLPLGLEKQQLSNARSIIILVSVFFVVAVIAVAFFIIFFAGGLIRQPAFQDLNLAVKDCEDGPANATFFVDCHGIHLQYHDDAENSTVYEPFFAATGTEGERGVVITGDNVWVQTGDAPPSSILPTTAIPDVNPEQTDPLADTRTAVAACLEGTQHIVIDEGTKLNSTEHTFIEFDVHRTCNDEFFPAADPSKVPGNPLLPQTLPYNMSYVPNGVFGIFPWNVTVQRPIYQYTPVGLPEGNPTLLQQWYHEGDDHGAYLTSTADTVWLFAAGPASTRLLLKSSDAEIILGHGHVIFYSANWHQFDSWYDADGGMITAKGIGLNAPGAGYPWSYLSGENWAHTMLITSDVGWVPGKTVGFSLGESGYGIYNTYGHNIYIKSPWEISIQTADPTKYVYLRPSGPNILTIPSHDAGIVFSDERYMLKLYGDYHHIPGAPGWPMVLQGYTGVLLGTAFTSTDPPDQWIYFEYNHVRTSSGNLEIGADLYLHNHRLHLSYSTDDHYWIERSNDRVSIYGHHGARVTRYTGHYLDLAGPQLTSSTGNLFLETTSLGVMQGQKIYFSAFSTTENPMDMQTFPNPAPALPDIGGLTPSSVDGGYWMGHDAGRMAIQSYTGLFMYATDPAFGLLFTNSWIHTYDVHMVLGSIMPGHNGNLYIAWPTDNDFAMTYETQGGINVELIRVDNDGGNLPSPGARFGSHWDTHFYAPATAIVRGDAAVQINSPYIHLYSDAGGPGVITDTYGAFWVQTHLGHSIYLGVDGGAQHSHFEMTGGLTWLETETFSHAGHFENHFAPDGLAHHEYKYNHPYSETTDTAWSDHEFTPHCPLHLWEQKHTQDSCFHEHWWRADVYKFFAPGIIINPASSEELTETNHMCLQNGTDCRDLTHTKLEKSADSGSPVMQMGVQTDHHLVNMTASLDVSQRAQAAAFISFSDERLKENIADLDKTSSISRLKSLRPVEYQYTAAYRAYARTTAARVRGFLSQEVQAVCAECIDSSNSLPNDPTEYQTLDKLKLMADIVAVTKDLLARVEALEGA